MRGSALAFATLLLGIHHAQAATPLDAIEQALTAEQHSLHKQSQLTFTRNGMAETTLVEINQPDQMHMLRSASGHKMEVYAVKLAAYWRLDSGAWQRTSLTGKPLPQPPMPPIKLLLAGMTGATELPASIVSGVKARSFRSNIAWSSGMLSSQGTVTLVVQKADLLPLSMTFKGQCGPQSCEFEQKFSYRTDISIKAPE
jgi:hypothetical protein